MSNRFHNKYHRHNHHTVSIQDVRYPDAAHDPIASYESPFLGDFVIYGTVNAKGSTKFSDLSSNPAGIFEGDVVGLRASAPLSGIAIESHGHLLCTGSLSAGDITFTGDVIDTYDTPVTASGKFLVISIGNTPYGIRLWNLS